MKYLIASLFLLVSACTPSFAQDRVQKITITKTYFCSNHAYVVNDLEQNYGESRKGWGVSVSDQLIEFFINEKTGRWTILFSNPNKLTCGLVGGDQGFVFDISNPSDNK